MGYPRVSDDIAYARIYPMSARNYSALAVRACRC